MCKFQKKSPLRTDILESDIYRFKQSLDAKYNIDYGEETLSIKPLRCANTTNGYIFKLTDENVDYRVSHATGSIICPQVDEYLKLVSCSKHATHYLFTTTTDWDIYCTSAGLIGRNNGRKYFLPYSAVADKGMVDYAELTEMVMCDLACVPAIKQIRNPKRSKNESDLPF